MTRVPERPVIPLLVLFILAFGWYSSGEVLDERMMVYVCLGGVVFAMIWSTVCTKLSRSSSKAKMTPPASKARSKRTRSISRDLEKNSTKTVLGTIMEMNRICARRSEISRKEKLFKFSHSVDLEVENFSKRLMKSQSESPDTKIKLKLPKGALEKMKRISLKSDDANT